MRDDLPALAGAGGWVVRDDHCFGRILLDHAVGRCWYEVLDRRRVAFRQLEDDQLRAALVLARRIAAEGDSLLRRLDAQSRQWRGKPRRRGALDIRGQPPVRAGTSAEAAGGRAIPPATGSHVVLDSADSEAYASLRNRPMPRAERYAMGKALRQQVPRSSLADWFPPGDRRDPVVQLAEAHEGRVPELVAIRVGRMVGSPYGFLRGAAALMAEDVAGLPSTGVMPVICGDAHVGNVGF